ncbi:MAG: hypothetical protein BGO77_04530 [Caedibacter sp. 37-49]|nr:MAG: hypothetical protein BGO77_04530 [Caedibacter sp. 37-49]
MNNVRQIVEEETLKLLNETNKSITVSDLKDSANLESLGMTSIDWARLLAILEIKLNKTPFKNTASVTDISTFGEVITAYTQSAKIIETEAHKDSVTRATARRQARTLHVNRKNVNSTSVQSE